jgi:hypothetical protein
MGQSGNGVELHRDGGLLGRSKIQCPTKLIDAGPAPQRLACFG